MSKKMYVIHLYKEDIVQALYLLGLAGAATTNQQKQVRWAQMAEDIRTQMEYQEQAEFFQCVACGEVPQKI